MHEFLYKCLLSIVVHSLVFNMLTVCVIMIGGMTCIFLTIYSVSTPGGTTGSPFTSCFVSVPSGQEYCALYSRCGDLNIGKTIKIICLH